MGMPMAKMAHNDPPKKTNFLSETSFQLPCSVRLQGDFWSGQSLLQRKEDRTTGWS